MADADPDDPVVALRDKLLRYTPPAEPEVIQPPRGYAIGSYGLRDLGIPDFSIGAWATKDEAAQALNSLQIIKLGPDPEPAQPRRYRTLKHLVAAQVIPGDIWIQDKIAIGKVVGIQGPQQPANTGPMTFTVETPFGEKELFDRIPAQGVTVRRAGWTEPA